MKSFPMERSLRWRRFQCFRICIVRIGSMSRPSGREGTMTSDTNKHIHLYPSNSFKSYDIAFLISAFHYVQLAFALFPPDTRFSILPGDRNWDWDRDTHRLPSIRNRQPPNPIILDEELREVLSSTCLSPPAKVSQLHLRIWWERRETAYEIRISPLTQSISPTGGSAWDLRYAQIRWVFGSFTAACFYH